MRAGVVGNELGCANPGGVLVARVRDFDRRVQRGDRGDHLVDGVCLRPRGRSDARRNAIPPRPRKSGWRRRAPRHPSNTRSRKRRPASGPLNLQVLLPCQARRRDLPAEQRLRRSRSALDRVSLPRACATISSESPQARPACSSISRPISASARSESWRVTLE